MFQRLAAMKILHQSRGSNGKNQLYDIIYRWVMQSILLCLIIGNSLPTSHGYHGFDVEKTEIANVSKKTRCPPATPKSYSQFP